MFKLFRSKKKAKKEKELQQQQNQPQQLKDQQQQIQTQNEKSSTSPQKQINNENNKENTEPSNSHQQQQQQQLNEIQLLEEVKNNSNVCEDMRIMADKIKRRSLKQRESKKTTDTNIQHELNVETHHLNDDSCQCSPSGFNDSHNEFSHQHHLRGSQLSTTISGADLNRILTSGYLSGDDDMGYLRRCVDLKVPKSPHFHRPASTLSSSINTVKKIRHCSSSPTRNEENEEPIRLAKYSGGYIPDPQTPKKIESLDWPSPPYAAAVPELRSRSRSSSNRKTSRNLDDDDHQTEQQDQLDSQLLSSSQNGEWKKTTKTKTYRKIYDNDYDDYLLKFKRNKNHENEDEDDDEDEDENLRKKDPKLQRELEEIAKLESKSGIAKVLAQELKSVERISSKHLKLNPWKASRTPNANLEPSVKTRYDSPVYASPSRINYGYKSHNLSHNSYDEGLSSTPALSSTSTSKDANVALSSTTIVSSSTPKKMNTIPKTPVPKPGYGLSSPKSITLPNSSRYGGMSNSYYQSTHRSVDFDSPDLAQGCYYSAATHPESIHEEKRKLTTYKDYYIESRNAHTTRSTPNLIGTPKIYKYSELRLGYKKKLPPDVDRERLERHLTSDELMKLFGVLKLEQFYELPEWKRTELKKKAKLF